VRYPSDVEQRLRTDFPGERLEVARAALAELSEVSPRLVRCVLHLAGGSVQRLREHIADAQRDWRDVILWAEYEEAGPGKQPRRLRDFNRPFPEAGGEGGR
jgi:hypothetical protein